MTIEDEVTDEVCEECGRNMVIKWGRFGKFLACPGFPECKNTRPLLAEIGVACPECGKPLVERRSRRGRTLLRLQRIPRVLVYQLAAAHRAALPAAAMG